MTITRNWIVPQIEPRSGGFAPPLITTVSLPNATATSPYSFTMSAVGGVPPYTWSITSQTDSTWLTITAAGVLQGTPTAAEIDSVNIKVQDSIGLPTSPTNFSLTVNPPPTGFNFYIGPNAPVTNVFTNSGTLANPANLAALNDVQSRLLYAGTRIGILDGTYNVNAVVNSTTGNDLGPCYNIEGGTSPSSPTVVKAVNNRKPVFNGFANNDGSTYPTNGRSVLGQAFVPATGQASVNNMGNVVIDGLYFTGGNGGFVVYDAEGLPGAGTASGWVFQNCETYNTTGDAGGNLGHFKTRFANGVLVQNNIIHGTYSSTGTLANSSLIFSFNSINGLYQYNTLSDSPTGIHLKNIHQNNDTIQFNYIELNGLTGAQTTPTACIEDCTGGDVGTTTTVQNNILVVPASGGNASWWFGSDAQNPPTFQNSATYCSIVFANNTCITAGQGGMFLQNVGNEVGPPGGPGGTPGSPSAKLHMYNNLFISTGAYIVSTANGVIGQCSGTDCQGVQDYNIWSCTNPTTFSPMQTRVAASFAETNSPISQGTFSQIQTNLGVEFHSSAATIAPATLFANPNVTLTPTGYQLVSGSPALAYGRVGGVSTGAACDAGAWGGPSPPAQIGSNLPPLLFLGNSLQGISLQIPGPSGTFGGGQWIGLTGTDTKYGNVLPLNQSPWGGTPFIPDQIQQIYNSGQNTGQTDIVVSIATDNTVPSGVSNQVLVNTLVNPYNGTPQCSYLIEPDTTVAPYQQGMLYVSQWIWLQDTTTRGTDFEQEVVEWKSPDSNGVFLGPERFQVVIFQANNSHGFSTSLPNWVFAHNAEQSNSAGILYAYMSASLAPNNSFTSKGYTAGLPKANAAVPLSRWFKLEWAFNRLDQSGQGWMWCALTDPGSSDPQLQAGTTIFQARGAFNYTDPDANQSWTNGMNPGPAFAGFTAPQPYINRIFLNNLAYGQITRSAASPYVIKFTDVQVYTAWPSTATAHPANYR